MKVILVSHGSFSKGLFETMEMVLGEQQNLSYVGLYPHQGVDILKENIEKEFTKADLKDGMVIETRERGRYLVLGNIVVRNGGYNRLSRYGDDLKEHSFHNKAYDIVRVFKVRNDCSSNLEGLLEDCNLEIIWDRKETKRMTAEAMRQKLEELTGEKIEVEPSREEMIGACYEFCNKRKCLSTCALRDSGTCTFRNYSDEQLKECYEKAMKDERKES